jgi:hypothetical protein
MQPELHAPFAQYGVAPEHTVPQAPQLLGSTPRSTHVPLHAKVPSGQPQEPPLHTWPAAQRLPHAPQLFGSSLTGVHVPPQSSMPAGQRHTPPPQL